MGRVLAVLFVAEVVASLEASMLYSALPTIAREHGLTGATWLITAYALVSAAAAVLGSRLGDMYGRKRALLVVLLVGLAGSVISALARDLAWIVAGRMLQGATGAILPLSFGIARAISPPDRVQFSIGTLTGAWAGSAALGYVLGGLFAEHGHWQQMFWVTASLPVLVMLACARIAPADHLSAPGGRVDWLGAALLVPGIVLIQLGIGRGAERGWDLFTLGELFAGALLLAIWSLVELRVKAPLVDVRQLVRRKFAAANAASALVGMGAAQAALVVMMLLQQPVASGIGFGLGATLAGLVKLPSNLLSLGVGPLTGHFAGRRGAKTPIIFSGVLMTIAWIAMLLAHTQIWQVIVAALLSAVGGAMAVASIANLVVEVAPSEDTSAATAVVGVVRGVFAAIGAQILGLLLAGQGHGGRPDEAAYMHAMGYVAVTSIGVLAIGLLIPASRAGRPGVAGEARRVGAKPA